MLSPREIQIARKLLTSPTGLRIKGLSGEFNVSSRTIQYDLAQVKDFLARHRVAFCSSPGKGIWVECTEEERAAARESLSGLEKGSVYLTQEARAQRILLQLIFQKGYVTANALAEALQVSRNTVLGDMDHIDLLLADSGMQFKRQLRQGYRLEGREIAVRAFAENLLQEGMSVYDIYEIVNQLKTGARSDAPGMPIPAGGLEDYHFVSEVMARAFREDAARLQQENIVLLTIRLLLAITRVRMQRFVGNPVRACNPDIHYLYPYLEQAFKERGLPVLRDEVAYILGRYQEEMLPVDVAALCADLVDSVSRMEDFPYYEDETLYPRLLTHVRHSFSSEKSITAPNPFHNLVLQNHAHLYESIQLVCKEHVDSSYLFTNDSFISYLALHFLLSQNNLGVGRKLRVVFVCSTGRGAAKLLERILEAELRRIQIVRHCSLSEVESVVESQRPDFIISVFPITTSVPVVLVEPLPTKANIEAIQKVINELTGEEDPLYHNQAIHPRDDSRQEELAQEVILIGLRIYTRLRKDGAWVVEQKMEIAFLAHVMLLASRYVFDKQFNHNSAVPTQQEKQIEAALAEIDIRLTQDEIKALTYYFVNDGSPIKPAL